MTLKKYENLTELKAAYDSGELSKEIPLSVGAFSCSIYADGSEPQPFQMNSAWVLDEALTLLGIPFVRIGSK